MFTLTCNYDVYNMTIYEVLVIWKKNNTVIPDENSMHLTTRFTGIATYTCGINITINQLQGISKYYWTDMSDTPKTVTGQSLLCINILLSLVMFRNYTESVSRQWTNTVFP